MYSKTYTAIVCGIEGILVSVECDVSEGMPMFDMVGFLSAEAKEARERVRAALKNVGYHMPIKRITVNISPASIRKSGTGYDLPIAIGILTAMGLIPQERTEGILIGGELGLNGEICGIAGVLPMVLEAKKKGLKSCMVPYDNYEEALLAGEISIIPVKDLTAAIEYFTEGLLPEIPEISPAEDSKGNVDFAQVKGQQMLRRACEVAVSGMHNLLMIGPPGAGKTMVAKRIPTILPELTREEALELSKIYSVSSGGLKEMITQRPFRSPHHTISDYGLTGGGAIPKPGEISLAHNGVLFLDEMTEFKKSTLEILRQPMEDREIMISRVGGNFVFPANFMLVAAMNPCKCGYFPDRKRCHCNRAEISRYIGKISQPLLDRIDICVDAPQMSYADLEDRGVNESSAQIRGRVLAAREIQKERFSDSGIRSNSEIPADRLEEFCPMDPKDREYMKSTYEKLGLTARTYHKILRVARTISDLSGEKSLTHAALTEALAYRSLDKKYWEDAL